MAIFIFFKNGHLFNKWKHFNHLLRVIDFLKLADKKA